jgi:hypothetical protein
MATLAFVGFLNWYGRLKLVIVRWVARNIFRNGFRSDTSADGLFMVLSSIFIAMGMMWIGIAMLYLTS